MTYNLRRRNRLVLSTACCAVLLGGCSATYDANFFDYDRQQSRTRTIFETQYAVAAAEEGTLRLSHFTRTSDGTGYRLNALGRERVDAIAAVRAPGEAVVVRLDVAADADVDVTHLLASASAYVATLRLPEGAMTLEIGPATHATPADESLAASQRQKGVKQAPQNTLTKGSAVTLGV